MSAVYDHCYKTVLRLTQEVGKLIRTRINEAKTVNTKDSEIDFVTETDKEVEKTLINGLSAEFPDHKFVGEESTSEGTSQKVVLTDSPTWVIDPVDGTLNFVHGYPHVCVSIALLVEKVPEIAIIYNPVVNQMFTARKGQGAFLNDQPIKASKTEDLSKALVCFEFGCSRNPEKMNFVKENVLKLFPQVHGLRSLGSAALDMAMVACGGADVYLEAGIHAWDIAAGDLIVREAGGVVMDPSGGPFDVLSRRVLCAGTKSLAEQMVKTVTQYHPPRDDAE
ncbi:inositol monophosphatase 1 [Ischnura elegans]|uniref:inositol monophosphatase 1 n=1 Tax=Ischnura elegans TaxID=197161 RepID=UPI001ED881F1|nr:inositol monophosphatase 1 [Ischnura elegans]